MDQINQRWKQITAAVAIAVGIGLAIVPFATSMFSRTSAANHLTTAVRPAMTRSALAAGGADLMTVQKAYGELGTGLLPAMATDLHESPAVLVRQLQTRYPEIRAGITNFDTAVINAQRILAVLNTNRARYAAADSLPVRHVRLSSAPWAYLAVGALFVIFGVVSLFRPTAGLAALALTALAVGVIPLALNVPSKLSDTRTLVHSLRDTLSPQAAATARAQYTTFATMLDTFDTKALPEFAATTHKTNAQLVAYVTAHAPALAPGAPDVARILAKFSGLTTALDAEVDNYRATAKLPLQSLAWLFVVPGFVLAALAAAALVAVRRPRHVTVPPSATSARAWPSTTPA
jgi:hypothetical protein